MSTKISIRSRVHTDNHPGFHLYDDVMEDLGAQDGDLEPPVYLCVDGLQVQLETLRRGGATVTLAFPRKMARELGLLPLEKT